MAKCQSCDSENTSNAEVCGQCGEAMLTFNSICGLPMLGGNSSGQVLGMRYIINQQVSEDSTGVIYEAEDVTENTRFLIHALPLTLSGNADQIDLLQKQTMPLAGLSANISQVLGLIKCLQAKGR